MSECLENQEIVTVNNDELLQNETEQLPEKSDIVDEIVSEEKSSVIGEDIAKEINGNDIAEFNKFLKEFAGKKAEIEKEAELKREYLSSNLAKYDSEDYFGNDSFKELYAEAFNSLGVNLDTEKFIKLLDDYVNSRIESNSKKNLAKKENEKLTDSFGFTSGEIHESEKPLRFQDIPADELEKYIAKYI